MILFGRQKESPGLLRRTRGERGSSATDANRVRKFHKLLEPHKLPRKGIERQKSNRFENICKKILKKICNLKNTLFNPIMEYEQKEYKEFGNVIRYGFDIGAEKMSRLRDGEVFFLVDSEGNKIGKVGMDSYGQLRECAMEMRFGFIEL